MERHTYINTERSVTKKEYSNYKRTCPEGHPMTYECWRDERIKREKNDFIKALWKSYPDETSPLTRLTQTIIYEGGRRERNVYYDDLAMALIIMASKGGSLKVSSRKDGIFTEQHIKLPNNRTAVIRDRIEILDDNITQFWIENGDDELSKLLRKDKSHIVNDKYDVLCDKVLV